MYNITTTTLLNTNEEQTKSIDYSLFKSYDFRI